MAFGFAGAGAGAAKALEEILGRQMLEAQMAQRKQEAAAQMSMDQQRLAQSAEQNAYTRQRTDRIDGENREAKTAAANQVATQRNAASDMAGVLAMPGMSNDAKANEIMGSGLRTGMVDPTKVIEGLTRREPRTPTRTVTVKGPNGPMEKAFTDEELAQGVDKYVEPPKPDKPQRTELTPGQAFSATRQLRNDYVRETGSAKTVAQQFALMQSSIAAAEKGDLAAGSQGVLVTFQKILDPNSVVRESEYARSASGQSLLSRMEGAVVKLQQGGAGVPVSELKKFASLAEQFALNQSKAAKESKAQIDAIANEYGLKPENITRDYGDDDGAKPIEKPLPDGSGVAISLDGGKTWKRK